MSEASITCPRCGRTSYNPNDVTYGYCGNCHDWTGAIGKLRSPLPFDEIAKGMYFDRQGQPISMARWAYLSELPFDQYRRVALDVLAEDLRVSTVWLGINMAFPPHPPAIFESMVFVDDKGEEMQRYSSEEEARHGHEVLVRSLRLVGRSFLEDLRQSGTTEGD